MAPRSSARRPPSRAAPREAAADELAPAAAAIRSAGRVDGRERARLARLGAELRRVPGVQAAAVPVELELLEDPPAEPSPEPTPTPTPAPTPPSPVGPPNDEFWYTQWGPDAIGARGAWALTRGRAEIVVAVVDSGVDLGHPDLKGRLIPGTDFGLRRRRPDRRERPRHARDRDHRGRLGQRDRRQRRRPPRRRHAGQGGERRRQHLGHRGRRGDHLGGGPRGARRQPEPGRLEGERRRQRRDRRRARKGRGRCGGRRQRRNRHREPAGRARPQHRRGGAPRPRGCQRAAGHAFPLRPRVLQQLRAGGGHRGPGHPDRIDDPAPVRLLRLLAGHVDGDAVRLGRRRARPLAEPVAGCRPGRGRSHRHRARPRSARPRPRDRRRPPASRPRGLVRRPARRRRGGARP